MDELEEIDNYVTIATKNKSTKTVKLNKLSQNIIIHPDCG